MTAPDGATPRSAWWLAFRVFDEPGQVFADLAQRPRGLVPILVLSLAFVGVAAGVPSTVLRTATVQQFDAIERSRPGLIKPEVREQALRESGGIRGRLNILFAIPITLLIMSLTAAILSLVFNSMSGTEIGFRDEWAIVTHAGMALAVGTVVTWVGISFAGDMTFRVALGFLVPKETSQFGHSLAQQFTVFGAWYVYLLALGNQIKMKAKGIGTPLAIIGGMWTALNLLFAWLSSMMGGMMG